MSPSLLRRLGAVALFVAAVAGVAGGAVRAETLIAAASSDRIEIHSNFSGTSLTVYGSIERDAGTVGRAGAYDVAVILMGPERPVVTRRKDRVVGLWVNRDARTYHAPSFYAAATTRAVADTASPQILAAARVGIDALILPESVPGGVEVLAGTTEFQNAFLRLQRRAGLYAEYPGAVKLLGPHLFSVTMPVPAEVPVGRYRARVVLFGDGIPLAEQALDITVAKTGFEQTVADLAGQWPVAYGLLSVAIALVTGWLGGVLFRRD